MSNNKKYKDEPPSNLEESLEVTPAEHMESADEPSVEEVASPLEDTKSPPTAEQEEPSVDSEDFPDDKDAVPAGLKELKQAKQNMEEDERELLDWLAANPEHGEDHSKAVHALAELTNRRRLLDGGWRAVDE